LEKYISLYPPEVRSREDGATPIHLGASSGATDEKREKLREWVRGMMRAGEMSSEPETLEHRQSVQKGTSRQWEDSIDKNERGIGVKEELKARQGVDVPDDFFEEDDTGNEDSEAEKPANTRLSELPAKRRPDKAEKHPDKHSKLVEEQNPKKAKRKKHRKVASPTTFFGDESE
jgi:hypothetical protein